MSGGSAGKPAGPVAKPRSARRRSREFAMQGVYQWLLSAESLGVVQAHIERSPGFDRSDRPHFEMLLAGSIREANELDALILPYLDRPMAQLSPVEHATLMVGCYELLRHPEIPYRVVINEAVEIAKGYGGTDGFKYVNGVLDRVAATVRSSEATSAAG